MLSLWESKVYQVITESDSLNLPQALLLVPRRLQLLSNYHISGALKIVVNLEMLESFSSVFGNLDDF